MRRMAMAVLGLALVVGIARPASAQLPAKTGDWPGWRGADRTGVSAETGLLKEWPKDGPKLLWKATGLGEGYSTPSLAAGRIFVMGNEGTDNEYVQARDVRDGKLLWTTRVGKVGPNIGPQWPGARSTPTVDGDLLYALGSDGDLACLETATGKIRWQKNLRTEYGGIVGDQMVSWAYSESPLVVGDVVVCTPGGPKATLVALDKKSGKTVWQAAVPAGDSAAYGSAIVTDAGGVRQYVQAVKGGLVSIAAKDGKFLWRYDKTAGRTNCTTAIAHDGLVYSSLGGAGPGGAVLLKPVADGGSLTAEEVYLDNKVLKNHHGGVIRVGDSVYGTSNLLICQDFKTGEIKWQERSAPKGSIVVADGHIYLRGEQTGVVILVEATPTAYKEKGRFTPPDRSSKPAWPHPVVAGGRLYLRDQDVLLCYDVKAP